MKMEILGRKERKRTGSGFQMTRSVKRTSLKAAGKRKKWGNIFDLFRDN